MITTVTLNPALDRIYWVDRSDREAGILTRAEKSLAEAGGKGINVSLFLARLGVETVAMGFIAGLTGRLIESDLREEGVTTNFVWTDGETRTNIAILERGREAKPIEVNESGPRIDATRIDQFLRKYRRILKRTDFVVLSGSLPPGVPSGFYRELVELARDEHVPAIINTGEGPIKEAVTASPYLIKPDIRERQEVEYRSCESRAEALEVAHELIGDYAGISLISHETMGDILITPDKVWDLESRRDQVQVVNIIGAGDAIIGGIIYKLLKGDSIEEAARFGMAAAIASAESPEKVVGDLNIIETEMAKVEIRELL